MTPQYFMALLALLPLIMAGKTAMRGKTTPTVDKKDVLASTATWTYFTAYPACCPGLPNYDPNADTTECTKFNRCAHPGDFVALGQRDPTFVQNNNLVSFFDKSDPTGANFYAKYGDKTMSVTATCNGITQVFNAVVADTCGNSDCQNCCNLEADPTTGYLLTMEYFTLMKYFGDVNCANASNAVSFSIDTTQALVMPNCGTGTGGSCNVAQTCCSADSFCGSGLDFCGSGCQGTYGPCAGNYSCGLINGEACATAGAPCCSQYGYCAATEDACGAGCQSVYGSCDTTSGTGGSSSGAFTQFSFAIAFFALPFLAAFFNL